MNLYYVMYTCMSYRRNQLLTYPSRCAYPMSSVLSITAMVDINFMSLNAPFLLDELNYFCFMLDF